MLYLKSFTFNPFQENTYIAYDDSKKAVVFDPGCYEKREKDELAFFIQEEQLELIALINTHCHVDHVLGNAFIKQSYQVPLWIHSKEIPVLKSVSVYAPSYGFHAYEETEADQLLDTHPSFQIGNEVLEIRHVPGHAPGHIVFYHAASGICIAGDTLFQGSIGRTDLPGGDHQTLLDAIRREMFTLPEATIVYPGHGPSTSIGFERAHNPFVGKNARF